MKTHAIGDIHGCLDTLQKFLEFNLRPEKGDRIIFLGDYIDRGPKSAQTIEFVYDLVNNSEEFEVIALMGNHEDMFLEVLERPDSVSRTQNFLCNGGDRTVQSYLDMEQQYFDAGFEMHKVELMTIQGIKDFYIPKHHIEFIQNLPLRLEDEEFHYVHAGMRPLVHPSDQEDVDLLWIRYEFLYSQGLFGGKRVVHGHTHVQAPEQHMNRINIDCGLGKGGNICGLSIPGMEKPGKQFFTRAHEPGDIDANVTELAPPEPSGGWT